MIKYLKLPALFIVSGALFTLSGSSTTPNANNTTEENASQQARTNDDVTGDPWFGAAQAMKAYPFHRRGWDPCLNCGGAERVWAPLSILEARTYRLLDAKVSPEESVSPKREISRVVKTKKNNVERRRASKSSLAPKDHPSWTEVVRKGKWSVRFAEPKRLKQ
jgi:hypothetical protein